MKVLVADDSITVRFNLKESLTNWGFEVVEADTGRQAVNILTAPDPPRIAIIDWIMPQPDGPEVCRLLRARQDAPLIYTILLTVKRDPADMTAALEAGAHSFLSKPVVPPVLRSYVNVGRRLVEAEDQAKRSERALRLITDSVSEGLALFDENMNLVRCNRQARRLLGLGRGESPAMDFRAWYQKAEGLALDELLDRLRSGGRAEAVWRGRPGRAKEDWQVHVYFKSMQDQGLCHVLAVLRDITCQARQEREHQRAEQLKAALETAGAACRELTQPLQAVMSGLELGLMNVDRGTGIHTRMVAMHKACLRMAEITGKLRRVTRDQT